MTNDTGNVGKYIYDRQTGLFQPYGIDVTGDAVSIDELSNGRYTLAGTMIWDTQNNIAAGDIKPLQDNYLVHYPTGHLEHFVEVPMTEINSRYYTRAGYAVSAEFDVDLPNGTTYKLDLDYSKVAPPGRFLYIRDADDWKNGYRWVEYIPGMSDTMMDMQGDIWTKASVDEAIEYMLRGLMLGKYGDMIQEMINNGLTDQTGKKIETVSDATAFLATVNMDSVAAARFTYLPTGE